MNNKENRKLSTILAMDVVGYSSKMADDDEGTLKLLAERRLIIEKNTKNYGGRIFNTAGDAFMIDFSSPVEAVKAAIKIQQEIFHLKHVSKCKTQNCCRNSKNSKMFQKFQKNPNIQKLSSKSSKKIDAK